MLPCSNPTRMGTPASANAFDCTRHVPQPMAAASTRPDAMTPRRASGRWDNASTAAAVDTSATSADSPYTPVTLASWTTGSTVACDAPSRTHGKFHPNQARNHSEATHNAGASHTPATPNRRVATATSQLNNPKNNAR